MTLAAAGGPARLVRGSRRRPIPGLQRPAAGRVASLVQSSAPETAAT